MSDGEEHNYFGDAITEEIIMQLINTEGLTVRSRTSIMQYKGTTKTSPVIGKELKVNYLIVGSAQRFEDQVKIRVNLINAENDKQLWSATFETIWKDILTVQSKIARQIAENLRTVLSTEELEKIDKKPTKNPEAYDYYLKGNEEHWKYFDDNNPEHINKSIEYFLKAIELDPVYSKAYTGLGREYYMLGHYAIKPSPEFWIESKRLLEKAISIDPENGWAYAELGAVLHNWDSDSSSARKSFERAIALSPNDYNCYIHYFIFEFRLGNCEKLAFLDEKYFKINEPEVLLSTYLNIMILTCRKDFGKIRDIAEKYQNNEIPIEIGFYFYLAYVNDNNYKKALRIAEEIINKSSDKSINLTLKGHIAALMGDKSGAREILKELNTLSESRYISKVFFANIYDALGDREHTIEFMEKALSEHDWRIHGFYDVTSFNLVKKEPWLDDVIRRSWIPLKRTSE